MKDSRGKNQVLEGVRSIMGPLYPQRFDRIHVLMGALFLLVFLICFRLFRLQVVDAGFYKTMASDQHQIQRILQPERGDIFIRDHQSEQDALLMATDKDYFQIYAVPQQVSEPEEVAKQLVDYVAKTEEELIALLSKENDPYEPIEKKVAKERYEVIKNLELDGIHGVAETYRYYVADNVGSQVIGFVGQRDDKAVGLYGVEGHFDDILAGTPGLLASERDTAGRWIALAEKDVDEAKDGADIYLTMDQTLLYQVCEMLNQAILNHGAESGTVIVMDPETGKILSMCSAPDYNPNFYSKVNDAGVYNNKAIYDVYEPGSIFKPLVMSAAMDLQYVNPESTYTDYGSLKIDKFTIRNANDKVYGVATMTEVLENSINTGMIHVANLMGTDPFRDYVLRYGFGDKVGINLDSERKGDIRALNKKSEIFRATASFGQGITATPIQMVQAYGALANGGRMMKPYIIDEIHYADGSIENREPEVVREVIKSRTALLVTGMLTSVVNNGHAGRAGVDGYYLAGKTGTAQIPNPNGPGYLENDTIHSFVGYGPVDDPKFVMLVKLDKPKSARYSSSTSAGVFGDIAKFILNYYDIPPDIES